MADPKEGAISKQLYGWAMWITSSQVSNVPEGGAWAPLISGPESWQKLNRALMSHNVGYVTGSDFTGDDIYRFYTRTGAEDEGAPRLVGIGMDLIESHDKKEQAGVTSSVQFNDDEIIQFAKRMNMHIYAGGEYLPVIGPDGRPMLDPNKVKTVATMMKAQLGLSAATPATWTDVPSGQRYMFIGEEIVTLPKAAGNWQALPLGSGLVGVIKPDGEPQVVKVDSPAAKAYSMLAERSGDDIAATANPQAIASGAVARDVVPGYDAVQTSAGKYQLVKRQPVQFEIGDEVPLPDGRVAIKIGPDKFETLTPGDAAWFTDK